MRQEETDETGKLLGLSSRIHQAYHAQAVTAATAEAAAVVEDITVNYEQLAAAALERAVDYAVRGGERYGVEHR